MSVFQRRYRVLGLIALLAVSLGIVSQGWADRARQEPTPAFGPIITAPPEPTAVPGAETPTPTRTRRPTRTPGPTQSPTPTPTLAPTVVPTITPAISPTPLPTYRADVMGIQVAPNIDLNAFDNTLWLVGRLGVKWIKLQFAWDELEPQQGTFSQTFYTYRLLVQRANQQGLNVMISIVKAPAWARATAEEDGPPINPQDLASFITRMMSEVRVDLYGNSYFDAIEIWNEPNLRREWNGGTISGAEYMRLFDAAYQGVRAGEGGQSVTVVTAGLAPTGINDGGTAVDDREFLRQMYQAGLGSTSYQNIATGVHPYGADNPPDARCCTDGGYTNHPSWFFLDTLEDYHTIMVEAGDTSRYLWATEFGWGT